MVSPFNTKPPWLRDEDLGHRCPFPESPPASGSRARFLDDEVVWTLFLKKLGGSEQEDAQTIDDFANRLGIDRNRILAKLAAHYHDNRTLQ
jgi:hypothetical protein